MENIIAIRFLSLDGFEIEEQISFVWIWVWSCELSHWSCHFTRKATWLFEFAVLTKIALFLYWCIVAGLYCNITTMFGQLVLLIFLTLNNCSYFSICVVSEVLNIIVQTLWEYYSAYKLSQWSVNFGCPLLLWF